MSMQITVDPTNLSDEQRQFVAGFILGYPTKDSKLSVKVDARGIADKFAGEWAKVDQNKVAISVMDNEAEQSPEAAFGNSRIESVRTEQAQLNSTLADHVHNIPMAATGQTTAAGVELDSAGLPWDARIHAESKNKIADGTWRRKRNLDAAVIAGVEAELRQVMGAPAALPVTADVKLPSPPLPPPPAANNEMPPIPASLKRAPTPPPPAANNDGTMTYVQLIGKVSAAIGAKKITQADATACCVKYGVPALPTLVNRLDLLPQISAEIDSLIASRA